MLQIKRVPQIHSVGKCSSGILYLIRVAYQEACFYRKKPFLFFSFFLFFFFLSGFSFTDTGNSQGSREREDTIFYSTLSLSLAHKHWDIYLQLCMWDDKFACLSDCYSMRFTTLSNYHLIDWLMMQYLCVYLMNWS